MPKRTRTVLATAAPVVFIRVGRLKYYDSRHDDDGPVGGGSFNDTEVGSEAENFHPFRGKLYGFAQVSRTTGGYNPRRVGITPNARGEMAGVSVVMVAVAENGGGQVVVGWYRDATLFEEWRDRPEAVGHGCNFIAPVDGAVLLPIAQRGWKVPKGPGGFGQSNVFYPRDAGGKRRNAPWTRGILAKIRAYDGPNLLDGDEEEIAPAADEPRLSAGQGPRLGAAENRAVEEAAMDLAMEYFRSRNYKVEDVHANSSYDLRCERTGEPPLHVEVKGTTGAGESVIVTANEVASARSNHTALFVVSKIQLVRGKRPKATGGEVRCILPWRPRDRDLEATQYRLRLS